MASFALPSFQDKHYSKNLKLVVDFY